MPYKDPEKQKKAQRESLLRNKAVNDDTPEIIERRKEHRRRWHKERRERLAKDKEAAAEYRAKTRENNREWRKRALSNPGPLRDAYIARQKAWRERHRQRLAEKKRALRAGGESIDKREQRLAALREWNAKNKEYKQEHRKNKKQKAPDKSEASKKQF